MIAQLNLLQSSEVFCCSLAFPLNHLSLAKKFWNFNKSKSNSLKRKKKQTECHWSWSSICEIRLAFIDFWRLLLQLSKHSRGTSLPIPLEKAMKTYEILIKSNIYGTHRLSFFLWSLKLISCLTAFSSICHEFGAIKKLFNDLSSGVMLKNCIHSTRR